MRPASMPRARVALIGVPMDLGSNLRGVDMGPSANRIAGVVPQLRALGCQVEDRGNLAIPHAFVAGEGSPRQRYADPVLQACSTLSESVLRALDEGFVPLVLGGDHSIAMGTLAGLSRYGRPEAEDRPRTYGLLWIDAHADCNTPESSPSGNIHGMPLAAALGKGDDAFIGLGGEPPMIDPARAVLLAVRDIDPEERENMRQLELRVITMREIDERGAHAAVREALQIVTAGTDGFHVSLDIDCLDPRAAPGVGTPVAGGLTVREAHLIMELVADTGQMVCCEVAEVNPVLDQRNSTAELAAGLISSAFGKTIF